MGYKYNYNSVFTLPLDGGMRETRHLPVMVTFAEKRVRALMDKGEDVRDAIDLALEELRDEGWGTNSVVGWDTLKRVLVSQFKPLIQLARVRAAHKND